MLSLFSLVFLVIITSLLNLRNPLVFGESSVISLLYGLYILLFIIFLLRVVLAKKLGKRTFLSFFVLLAFFPSAFMSEYMDVSLLKLIVFTIGFLGLINAFESIVTKELVQDSALRFFKYLLYSYRVIAVVSFFIYLLGFGYPRNPTGLGGILNHPQALGVVLSIFLILEFYFFIFHRKVLVTSIFLCFGIVLIFMTESRTALLAFLMGSVVLILMTLIKTNYFKQKRSFMKVTLLSVAFVISLPVLALNFNKMIVKHDQSQSDIIGSLQKSRLIFVLASFRNFIDNPIFGIGFQVSNGKYGHYHMEVKREQFFGLPVKASIEKGVFLPAALEEVGLVGFLALIFLLYKFIVYSKYSVFTVTVICTVFLTSFGESALFSFGSVGLVGWWFIFMASCFGNEIDKIYIYRRF